MFSFFKINDPYRLVAIFMLGLAIKLPFMLSNCTYSEMHHWLTIGEAMQTSDMYRGIFDSLAPLSSFTYWVVVLIFGKSGLALHLLGTLLMIVQAVIFNNLTIRNKVYEQNTYLPAFVYLVVASSHYSLSVFSPAQLGMTFVMMAFSQMLSHVEFRAKRDEQIMSIGLLIGVATLFYLPLFIFLPIVLFELMIFTNTMGRRYFVLIISSLVPFLLTMCVYWVRHDSPAYFITNFLLPSMQWSTPDVSQFTIQLPVYAPLIILLLIGLISMPKQRRLNNYQTRLVQLFLFTALLSCSFLFLASPDLPSLMIISLPAVAFFGTHLFYLVRKPLLDLIYSLLFLGIFLGVAYQTEYGFIGWPKHVTFNKEISTDLAKLIKDKRIWVIGDEPELYRGAKLGSGFYNWQLSKPVLDHLDYYDNLVFIDQNLRKFNPEIILDYAMRWRQLAGHIPRLQKQYEQVRPFVWRRKE